MRLCLGPLPGGLDRGLALITAPENLKDRVAIQADYDSFANSCELATAEEAES
jgi:hypothetical protein